MPNNYDEIKEALQKLQEKVEILEKENQELKSGGIEVKEPEENNKHIEILDNISQYADKEMDKIFEVNSDIIAASICVSRSKTLHGSEINKTTTCIKSFDEIDENKLSLAVEVFTNPRRITILKVLLSNPSLTATEITQKTGLVGGQLYHHLLQLENEQFISKESERYKPRPCLQGMLLDLYNIFGFGLEDTLWKLNPPKK